jgi:phage tail-like protein
VSQPFPSALEPSNPLTGFRFIVTFSDATGYQPHKPSSSPHRAPDHQSSAAPAHRQPARPRRPKGPSGAVAQGGVKPSTAGFSEISGLDSSIEIFDYKEGGRNDFVHKLATRASFGNITFKRGVALTPDLWQWFDKVRQGSFGARRGVMIAHLAADGTPALVWLVTRALPLKYVGPSWNAGQSSVAIESLEIAHEGLELIPTP